MPTDDARPVPQDRSGVDPIPLPAEPDEEPDQGWAIGVDRANPDGTITRVPIDLANTVYDPDWIIRHDTPATPPGPPPPRGGEVKRTLHRAPPGVLIGGQAARPVLQDVPKDAPADRVDIDHRELRKLFPDEETRRILGWVRLIGLLGLALVGLMIWYNLG